MIRFPELPRMHPGPMRGSERTYVLDEVLLMPNGDAVHLGFESDGLSIPRWAQLLLGPHDGVAFVAGLAHDWRYRYSNESRLYVDREFLRDMKVTGPTLWKRKVIYRGVRVGGSGIWSAYRRR